jgi:peptidylprolyl isomerase
MTHAKMGNRVKVHYKGSLDDGRVFESSLGCDPLEFTIGGGQVISGFEEAVIGMSQGDKKTTKVTADKAYGPYFQEMVVAFERTELPNNLRPEVGQVLQFRRSDGYRIQVVVAEVSETSVTFDGNHPLAGKDLTFEIELIEIA